MLASDCRLVTFLSVFTQAGQDRKRRYTEKRRDFHRGSRGDRQWGCLDDGLKGSEEKEEHFVFQLAPLNEQQIHRFAVGEGSA